MEKKQSSAEECNVWGRDSRVKVADAAERRCPPDEYHYRASISCTLRWSLMPQFISLNNPLHPYQVPSPTTYPNHSP